MHLGINEQNETFKAQIDRLSLLKQPAENYIIVITGDIVDNANDETQFEYAKAEIRKLEEQGYIVLLVPGNHDYGSGSRAKKKYVDEFKGVYFNNKNLDYPKLDIIEDVAFIGIDSMEEEVGIIDGLLAQGEIGEAQLNRLKDQLDSDAVKELKHVVVYLHHHPFDSKIGLRLKDSKELEDIISNRIDVILFGHNHDGKVWNGVWGIPRGYDGGSSTGKGKGPKIQRVIDLSMPPNTDYNLDL